MLLLGRVKHQLGHSQSLASPRRIVSRSAMKPSLHTATTSTRAKASFKKNGPRLPEHEIRRIERGATLDRRAEELKERDARRKKAREKARAKEAKDREGRAKIGLGLATQLVGFSHTQKAMKGAMEGFLGIKKTEENLLMGEENTIVEKDEVQSHETKLETKETLLPDVLDEEMFDDDVCLGETGEMQEEKYNLQGCMIVGEIIDSTKVRREANNLLDAVDPDMFDDDVCLEELGSLICEKESSHGLRAGIMRTEEPNNGAITAPGEFAKTAPVSLATTSQPPDSACSLEKTTWSYDDGVQLNSADLTNKGDPNFGAPTFSPPNASEDCPSRPVLSLADSLNMSPPETWGDMFTTGTQIGRELSQPHTPRRLVTSGISISPHLMADQGSRTDGPFDPVKNTKKPVISVSEGVVAHDFAYFKQTLSQNIVLGERVVPKSPSSFSSSKRKRGHKVSNMMVTQSPKTTSNCDSFTEAQVSFTADLTKYGYSTQIAESMFGDQSDTDEEDFSLQAQPASKRPAVASTMKDRYLMPPPPSRNSPKIFKPPSSAISPPEPGLGIGIWGVSTQDIRAVFMDDEELDAEEEEEFGSSLPSPRLQPKASQLSNTAAVGYSICNAPDPRLEDSPFIRPAAKIARVVSTSHRPHPIQYLRSAPSSALAQRATSLTPSFSAPPQHIPPTPIKDLRALGLSTQVLNDFAEEEVELSPVELKGGPECRTNEGASTFMVQEAGVESDPLRNSGK